MNNIHETTSLRFNFPGFHSPRVLKTPSICLSSSGLHLVVHLALHNIFLTVDHHSDHSLIIIFRIIDEKFDLAVKALKDHIFGYRAGSFLLTETLSPIPLPPSQLVIDYAEPFLNFAMARNDRQSFLQDIPGFIEMFQPVVICAGLCISQADHRLQHHRVSAKRF